MTKEQLDSDRLNYLIWRYLQESNYLETARHLQKEWNVEDPQQRFDFAPHVKHHTLVSLLQRGLVYHELERGASQAGSEAAVTGYFGPVAPLSPPIVAEEDLEASRKRQVEQQKALPPRQESPVKRARLSNGYENGYETGSMDVDDHSNGHGHAYPSPKEVERPPTPIIVATTKGPEMGTQVQKVAELTSNTTYLSFDGSAPKSIILYCQWHPRDPTILAAGTDSSLVYLWSISRAAASSLEGHVTTPSPPVREIQVEDAVTITAMSWSPDGESLAVAADHGGDTGSINIYTVDGEHVNSFRNFGEPVTTLHWNPTSNLVLALSQGEREQDTVITIYSPGAQLSATHVLEDAPLDEAADAVWTGEFEFIASAGPDICRFQCTNGIIVLIKKTRSSKGNIHGHSKIVYEPHSELIATTSYAQSEEGATWINVLEQGNFSCQFQAHDDAIISLLWQPVPHGAIANQGDHRILASSSQDGYIKTWKVGKWDAVPQCAFDMDSAVLALAFTPDGAFIAGATATQILIWKVDDAVVPRARWERRPDPGWNQPGLNGSDWEAQDEDEHRLSWDADGQKLAFAAGTQLAIIKWKP